MSGAGGVGKEGGVGFSFMDQEEQGRKAANERRVCSHADRSWPLGGGESPFCVSFMDLKKNPSSSHFLVRHVTIHHIAP